MTGLGPLWASTRWCGQELDHRRRMTTGWLHDEVDFLGGVLVEPTETPAATRYRLSPGGGETPNQRDSRGGNRRTFRQLNHGTG